MIEFKELTSTGFKTSHYSCSFSNTYSVTINGKDEIFRIYNDTDNCYCYTRIELFSNLTNEWKLFATEKHIGSKCINYLSDEQLKIRDMKQVLQECKTYITKILETFF